MDYFESFFSLVGIVNMDSVIDKVSFKVIVEMNKVLCKFFDEEEVFEVLK